VTSSCSERFKKLSGEITQHMVAAVHEVTDPARVTREAVPQAR
jgi:hypothetical protein